MATRLDKTTEREDTGGAGTLAKGFAVLEAVAAAPEPVRFADLLRSQPYPKATLHRLLKALMDEGMLSYDAGTHTYHPGLRLIRLAHAAWRRASLAEAAGPTLDRLARELHETLHLAVLDHAQVLYVDKRTSRHPVTMFSSTGKVGPAYCTGVGKAMLAWLPSDTLALTLGQQSFHRYTPATLTDATALAADLEATRARGYALDREEHEPGIICVAVPILSRRGGVLGALSVTATLHMSDLKRLEAHVPKLQAAGAEIAAEAAVRLLPGA